MRIYRLFHHQTLAILCEQRLSSLMFRLSLSLFILFSLFLLYLFHISVQEEGLVQTVFMLGVRTFLLTIIMIFVGFARRAFFLIWMGFGVFVVRLDGDWFVMVIGIIVFVVLLVFLMPLVFLIFVVFISLISLISLIDFIVFDDFVLIAEHFLLGLEQLEVGRGGLGSLLKILNLKFMRHRVI